VSVSLVEPGRVDTEISDHLTPETRAAVDRQSAEIEMLQPGDIADAVMFVVTRDRRVAVNEILVRAAEQTW
jgi:NADP-dependent 3-hydroxy acid dehydrogenase YdfG